MTRNEHEGSPGWRRGVEASIGCVKYRQGTLRDLQHPVHAAALAEVLVHLEAMLARGTERSTSELF